MGRGTFLRPATGEHAVSLGADDVGPADVMVARALIEPQAVPLAIQHATVRDFEEFDRCLDGGAAATSGDEFEAWDFAFHHAIVAAGHNQLIIRMYAAIEAARQGQLWGNLKRRNDSVERRLAYQLEHQRIVDALRAREQASAVEAMRAHLERVRGNLLSASDTVG